MSTKGRETRLWNSIVLSMKGAGPLRRTDVIERTMALLGETDEAARHRIATAISRWGREGRLLRPDWGMYQLPKEGQETRPPPTIWAPRGPYSQLWSDLVEVMGDQGWMRARAVLAGLRRRGHPETDEANMWVYNSLGRWHRQGLLEKKCRGVYRMPPNAVQEFLARGQRPHRGPRWTRNPKPETQPDPPPTESAVSPIDELTEIPNITRHADTGLLVFHAHVLPRSGETATDLLGALIIEAEIALVRCKMTHDNLRKHRGA